MSLTWLQQSLLSVHSPMTSDYKPATRASSLRRQASSSSREAKSSSLLNLPPEIRLQIYNFVFLPSSVVLQNGDNPAFIAVIQSFPKLISRGSRDVQLLRTCRTIFNEATQVFYQSLSLLVYQHLYLLRTSFLPAIGPLNATYIKRAIITPIGLPGEHQRFLECLGVRNGGLLGLDHLTLELWDADHIPAFISTCQELIQHHPRLKMLLGRGTEPDPYPQPRDIPATLRLARLGQSPRHREKTLGLAAANPLPPTAPRTVTDTFSGPTITPEDGDAVLASRFWRPLVSFSVPEPKATIWSRYQSKRKEKKERKQKRDE